jgi:diguanylate cyclase (GGDEF)-like protein
VPINLLTSLFFLPQLILTNWMLYKKLSHQVFVIVSRDHMTSIIKKGIFKSKLSTKLLARILLISGTFTVLITALQLYVDYRQGVTALNQEVSLLGVKYSKMLTRSVWELNHPATYQIIDSIKANEPVSYLELVKMDNDGVGEVIIIGSKSNNDIIDFEFPLVFEFSEKTRLTGYLRVIADKEKVIQNLYDTFYLLLLSQAFKTFFVSLLILLVFHQLIIRHVEEITTWLKSFSPHASFSPISENQHQGSQDELSFLKSSINDMGKLVHIHTHSLENLVEQRTLALKRQTQALEKTQTELHKILVDKELKLKEVSQSTGYWLWEQDQFGNVTTMNGEFSDLIGLTINNSSPQSLVNILPFFDPTEIKDNLANLIADKKVIEAIDCQLRSINNDVIWVTITATPKFNEHDVFCGYHGSAYDFTQQKHLENLAYTDGLTGIANRVAFFLTAEKELNRARRMAYDIGVMMLDLDYFKSINDSYGHEAGDEVLQKVANALDGCLREVDCVGRIGGEEFAIVVPVADKSGLYNLAKRLQASISLLSFNSIPNEREITISIGYTMLKTNETFKAALSRSDQHLYAAKTNGRNCFITDHTFIPKVV